MSTDQWGPYRIERKLGQGGMGAVFAAVHVETGEVAAIKVLAESLSADPRFRERFLAEVETLLRLRHPNIVTLQGHGEQEGRLFFVMELVDGPSLESLLAEGRRFPWFEAADIAIQVCSALKHAHDHGVIHRDLKPANLLVSTKGQVKLTDFGIARMFGASGLTLAVTPRTDLYSLGGVLYALVTGKPPFSGASVTQVIDRVRSTDPTPLQRVVPHVPDEFADLVAQLLRKDPAQRIATPLLLANRLRAMRHALGDALTVEHPRPDASGSPPEISGDRTVTLQAGGGGRDAAADARPTADWGPDQQATAELDIAHRTHALGQQTQSPTALDHAAGEEASAPPAPKTHFTRVSAEESRRAVLREEHAGPPHRQRLVIAALASALVLIGAAFTVVFWPPSADRLYRRIKAASATDPPAAGYERDLQEFLRRFPDDPRGADVARRLQNRRCQELRSALQAKLRSLDESERRYLAACEHLDRQQTSQARECLEEALQLLPESPQGVTEKRLQSCARHLLAELDRPADGPR